MGMLTPDRLPENPMARRTDSIRISGFNSRGLLWEGGLSDQGCHSSTQGDGDVVQEGAVGDASGVDKLAGNLFQR